MKKKKIIFLTDYAGVKTGYARNLKSLLTYLYKNYNDKLELVNVACGISEMHGDFARFPWKTIGVVSGSPEEIKRINSDPGVARAFSYGEHTIEKIIHQEKPDIIVAINDFWGTSFLKSKSFYKKIPIVFWTTIDSLPIPEPVMKDAKEYPYYWTWANFATKEFRKNGLEHVKTQYPCLDSNVFYRMRNAKRTELRQKLGIPLDSFIFGFVSRNQLRKLFNKTIESYALFKKEHPDINNTFLYFHTHYGEGWDLPSLIKQYGVNPNEVLCTYICRATKRYYCLPFRGQDIDNPETGHKKSLITTNVQEGVPEEQLNEIYNLFDVYSHLATSGACELGCVEAALTECPIVTCRYSFGEDIIDMNRGSLFVDFNFYTEFPTLFLKSNPHPDSVSKIMYHLYSMGEENRRHLGKASREWALQNYDTKINAEKIAKALLDIPAHNWDFKAEVSKKNPNYPMPDIADNLAFIKDLYKNILYLDLPDDDQGLNYWLTSLKNGGKREDVYKFFIQTALKDNAQSGKISLEQLLDPDDKGRRILITMPESAGDCILAAGLLEDIHNLYPTFNIYFATKNEYRELLEGNPYIHKIIPWVPDMDNLLLMEGYGSHKGYFDITYLLHAGTQRFLTYLHNGIDKTNINFKNNETIYMDDFDEIEESEVLPCI